MYVPGGTAVLPSSTLMLATPAQLAGCKTIVMATPPFKSTDATPGASDGGPLIPPEVAYCAKKAGVTHVLAAGGAQAVAAMAWGTESCPKVDKLFGPGNQFVTAAKMALQVCTKPPCAFRSVPQHRMALWRACCGAGKVQ